MNLELDGEPGQAVAPQGEFNGRPWGAASNLSRQTTRAILACFEEIGGLPALVLWAKDNRETFYTKIWAPLTRNMRVDIKGEGAGEGYQFHLGLEIDGDGDAERAVIQVEKMVAGQVLEHGSH